jgi:hypothetical protein
MTALKYFGTDTNFDKLPYTGKQSLRKLGQQEPNQSRQVRAFSI